MNIDQASAESSKGIHSIAIQLVGLEEDDPHLTDLDHWVRVDLPERVPLRFRHPILNLHISDADQDGVFVVNDTFSRVYGEGEEPSTAINDYIDSLLARFLDLEEHVLRHAGPRAQVRLRLGFAEDAGSVSVLDGGGGADRLDEGEAVRGRPGGVVRVPGEEGHPSRVGRQPVSDRRDARCARSRPAPPQRRTRARPPRSASWGSWGVRSR